MFADAQGGRHFGFGGFTARDANGKALPAHIELIRGQAESRDGNVRVALVVDDRAASYPVVLDPTILSLETEIGGQL